MADAYKGLTIQIGGDSTKLTAALKAPKSAAADLQSQIRKIDAALRLDTDSVDLAARKIELLGDYSQALTTQLGINAEAIKQLGASESHIEGATIADLAAYTENAALDAKLADERYNDVNATLESTYNTINKAARASDEFSDSFEIRDSVTGDIEETRQNLERMCDELVSAGVISEETAQQLLSVRDNWVDAFNEKTTADKVLKLQQLETETASLSAKVKSANEAMAAMSVPASPREEVDSLGARLEQARDKARLAGEALELDPTSIEKAARYTEALKAQSDTAAKKAEALGRLIESYPHDTITKAANATSDLGAEAEAARSEWERINTELDDAKSNLALAEDSQRQMELAARDSGEEYDALCDWVTDLCADVDRLESEAGAAMDAMETAEACAECQDLQEELAETMLEVEQTDSKLDSLSEGSASSMNDLGRGVRDVGDAFTLLSSKAQAALESIIESTDEVDSAYRDMRKTVDGTEEQYEALYDSAVALSSTSVVSADEILEIEAMGGQLGLAVDELEVFAETVANLTVASDLEADEAAEELGQLANILDDLTADTMPNFSDAMVRLGNNTAACESDILDVASRIGSEGSIIGLSSSEILAWSASIVETGQNCEAAGTAIANTFSDMETAVAEGVEAMSTMTEEELEEADLALFDFAEVAGMTASEFAETWESDPTTALYSFIEGLNGIEENGGSADATLENLGITGTRQKQAIEGLMQTIDGLNDNLQMSEDAWNGVDDEWGSAGDAANEAEAKTEGFSGALSRIQNVLQNIGAELGESLAPLMDAAADALSGLGGTLSEMSDGAKLGTVALLGVSAAAGPMIQASGNMIKGFSEIDETLRNVAENTNKTTIRGKALTKVLSKLSAKSILLGTSIAGIGIAALVAAVSELSSAFEEGQERIEDMTKASETFDDIVSDVEGSSYDAADAIEDVGMSADEAREYVDDVTESLADYNEEAAETLSATESDVSLLESYIDSIEAYGGKTELSATQLSDLQTALDYVNDVLGTNYELHEGTAGVIYDENGAVEDSIELIRDQAEAYADAARMEAYQNVLTGYIEEFAEAEDAYEYALEHSAEFTDDELEQLKRDYESASDSVAECEATISAMTAGFSDEMIEVVKSFSPEMQGAAVDVIDAFGEAIESGEIDEGALIDALEAALTGEGWSEVLALADQCGIDVASFIAEGMSEGGTVDTATLRLFADMALDLESGGQDTAAAALGVGEDLCTALAQAVEDGTADVDAATEALLFAAQGDEAGWNTAIQTMAENGIAVCDSVAEGIEDGSIVLDEATADLLADLMITSDDPGVVAAAQSYLGVSDYLLGELQESIEDGANEFDVAETVSNAVTSGDWTRIQDFLDSEGEASVRQYVNAYTQAASELDALDAANTIRAAIETGNWELLDAYFSMEGTDSFSSYMEGLEGSVSAEEAYDAIYDALVNGDMTKLNDLYYSAGGEAPYSYVSGVSNGAASLTEDEIADIILECVENGNDFTPLDEYFSVVGTDSFSSLIGGYGDRAVTGANANEFASVIYDAVSSGDYSAISTFLYEEGKTNAYSYASGLSYGAEESEGVVTLAGMNLGEAAAVSIEDYAEMHSPSKLFMTLGGYMAEGLALGIDGGAAGVETSATSLADTVAEELGAAVSDATDWGSDLTSNFASGLTATKVLSRLASAATTVADKVASIIGFSVPEEGPWSGPEKGGFTSGYHLAENFATGICSGIPEVESAAGALAEAARIDTAIDGLQRETALAVEAAASNVGADVALERRQQSDNADALAHALSRLAEESGSTTNYYWNGTLVASTGEKAQFEEEFAALMAKYGRLARQ